MLRVGRLTVLLTLTAELPAAAAPRFEQIASVRGDNGLVLHQFQERMVTNRDQLVSPPGIAFTIHMDGHGTREQKQDTYSYVHVDRPFHNAVKLFYDEDIDMYRPREILRGAFRPMPELITYQ